MKQMIDKGCQHERQLLSSLPSHSQFGMSPQFGWRLLNVNALHSHTDAESFLH